MHVGCIRIRHAPYLQPHIAHMQAHLQVPIFAIHIASARPIHEMALELVCGADFWCNRHCKANPVDLEGSRGQVWPEINRKSFFKFFHNYEAPRML